MITKKKTEKGHVVYLIDSYEQQLLIIKGQFGGICDNCMEIVVNKTVVYVPVLDWGMCEDCFNRWKEKTEYFPDDEWYEREKIAWFETQISRIGLKCK